MNIVVTDGYTLQQGDLALTSLESFGNLLIYDRTTVSQIRERCEHAGIVITNKVPFDAVILEQLPQLKLISVLATGYNVIDIHAAKQRGVVVCNVPAYGTASVATSGPCLMK